MEQSEHAVRMRPVEGYMYYRAELSTNQKLLVLALISGRKTKNSGIAFPITGTGSG